jgi:CRAL/TRIO, N-terminal domain
MYRAHIRCFAHTLQGHLTTAQAEALATMQTRFPDYKHFHNDHDLLRFLRARSFDVTAATKMYDKYCHVVSPPPL